MNDLYKVLTISEWENAKQNGFIETSLDIKDSARVDLRTYIINFP
jgi:uncharacterized protein (DUF952 family)